MPRLPLALLRRVSSTSVCLTALIFAAFSTGTALALTPQAISFTQPATPVTYSAGLTIPLSATGGPSGNPVVFTIDAASSGTGTITGNMLNVSSPGAFIIDANQAGNAQYTAAVQVQREIDINSATAQVTLIPSSVHLGFIVIGQNSPADTVTLENNGASSITITQISASPAPFAVTAGTCTTSPTVAAHSSCTSIVSANDPTVLGPLPLGQMTVTTTASNPVVSILLTGTAVEQTTLSRTSFAFGNVAINQTSQPLTATFTNNNLTTPIDIGSITMPSGEGFAFTPATTCPISGGTLNAQKSCTIAITFAPTALGATTPGSLAVNVATPFLVDSVPISGTGIVDTSLSPASLSFGNIGVNTTSPTRTITITNHASSALSFTGAVFNGPFALDTTSSIVNECPLSGGTLSGSLGAASSCVIGITFTPTALGATAGGKVTILDSDPSGPVSATLAGTGVAPTSLTPSPVAFGNVETGSTSAVHTVTLANNLPAALTLMSITAPAPFNVTGGTCSTSTPVGAHSNCTITMTFSPTSGGVAPASMLTVTDNAASGPTTLTANLTGAGIGAVTLSPATLGFGTVTVGQPVTKDETLTNNQAVSLTIDSIAGFTGGYSRAFTGTNDCGSIVAAGKSCIIAVTLDAINPGSQPGTITVNDNAPGSPQSFTLTANTVNQVQVSPASLAFATQLLGTTSAAKTVTLTNELGTPLTIDSAAITGADPNDFGVTSTCPTAPATLPGTSTCPLSVTFSPTASGTRTATLTISDSATNTPQSVTLTGSGNAPVLVTPGSITAYSARVGTTSGYLPVTIKNTQTVPLNIASLTLSGNFILTATSCGSAPPYVVAPGKSCTADISFDPTIGGTLTGQLQVYDDALTSPQVVNLSGNATSPLTITPGSLSFTAQQVNTSSAPKLITLTNHESQSETFTLGTTGDFSAATNCATGVIAAQSACNLIVTFTPSSTTPATRTGSLTIANSAPGGSTITAALTGSATATPPQASVAVVSPGAGSANTTVSVVITGNGWTHFSNSSVISFTDTNNASYPADITVQSFTAISPNVIDATLVLGDPAANSAYGARNILVQTPLTAGGTEKAALTSAFIIADPNQAFQITGVSPQNGVQGQTLNVNLTAVGTSFVQGVTYANFGDGITVDTLDITSPTTATATITISNTTTIGYRTITMVTGGEYAASVLRPDNNPIFYVGSNGATLVSVSPNSEPQGFSGTVTLTASGTHFLQNATQVSIGGVIVGDVNVQSPTVAVAQIAVPPGAPVGTQNVTVSTGGEIEGLNNAFTITGATPALVSVSPSSAQQGQSLTVTITGNAYTAFNACPGGVILADFSGEISSPTVNVISQNEVQIPITVAENAAAGGISANLTCGQAGSATIFPFSFSVTPSNAQIVSVVPNSIPQGGQVQVTVTGLNTDWIQGTTMAAFNPVPVPAPTIPEVTINSPTSAVLNIAVPTNTPAGSYGFYMATGGQVVSASINVYANTPTLTMSPANGMTPTNGVTNSFTANFTGQFTHFAQGTTVGVISGEGVTLSNFAVNTQANVTATLNIAPGAATGQRTVTFTTGGEIVTTTFNVTSTPVGIISISPSHGPQNTTLDVTIVGLNTHWVQGTTQVLFGPQITVNSVTVGSPACQAANIGSATCLTANITTSYSNSGSPAPTPPGYQSVYVNTGDEQVITGFSVDAPATPTIVSVSPSSAQQGASDTQVTITGNLTNWVQGESELILGAGITVTNLQIVSPTMATATIGVSPTAPVGGNSVIMITGSEVDSGTGFSVTPSAASIESVEPNFTCPQTTNFDVAGFNCTAGSVPNSVPVVGQLQTVELNIVGVGTHWLQGETSISFGGGVNIDSLTVTDPTHMQTQITVLSSAPVGYASLSTYTDGETVTMQQAIDIEEGSPTLLAISPGAAQQGATLTLQVLGRFTHFEQGVTQVTFNNNPDLSVVPNSINVIDSENMTVGITVSPLAYVDTSSPCGHEVVVTTGSEQVNTASIEDNFCVQQGAEEITGVSPLSAIQGSTLPVTITGSATNFEAGVTHVSFGDSNFQVGQITVNSPTSLTVPVGISTSATTGYKQVTVSTLGQVATQQFSFQVSPGVAQLVEAIPNQAEQGAPLNSTPLVVRLLGQYSHFNGLTTAEMGPGITVQSVQLISPTEIDATITIDPLSYVGGRTVTVTTPGVPCADQPPADNYVQGVLYQGCTPGNSSGTGSEIVTANVFGIIQGPAIITGVNPATGNEGQEVAFTISGSATHWQQNFTQFYIAGGGSDIKVNSVVINSATSATIDITISQTANPGTRSIFMQTNGESLTDSGAFVVTGGIPVVTSVSPNSALQGTTGLEVTINGNAYTQWNSTSTIGFGPGVTVASYQVDDASHIEAVLNIDANAQPGYRTVTVQTGTQVLSGYFQVTAPAPPPIPYIWYENPSSGIPGQTLTITFNGAYTHWDPNPTTGTQLTGFDSNVTINSFQVTSPTSALANVTISPDALAAGYDLTLTTGSEVENAGFSVVIAQPTLSVVDPGSAIQGAQNVTVNIIGQFTHFDSTTTFSFGGSGITVNGPPTILGPTIATQSISVGIEAPTGGYSVVSTTTDAPAGQQVVGGAGFSVTPSLAMIEAIAPNTALQGQTIQVEVTGQNTHWAGNTVFQFGAGIVVTSTQVNSPTDATLTLALPPLAPEGPTGATATTSGEVARINNGFVVQAGTPYLLSSGPGSLPQQSSAVFTVLSQSTTWSNANPPVVSYGPGVVVTNVNVTSPTSLTADGYVQPTTNVGPRNLTVTTGTQVLSLSGAFYVTPGPAVINKVTPNTAGQGTTLNVVVSGTNTNWQQGVTTLTFPGATVNTMTVTSANTINANITISDYATAGEVSLTATTAGEVATGVNVFTITQTQPEILSVVSGSGTQGQTETVTITGAFTSFDTSTSVANFGAGIAVNSVNALSSTQLQANITVQPTAALGYRAVSVTTGSQVVNLNNAFQVTVGPAAIQNLSPNTGGQGNSYTVMVTGSQTNFASGVTTASFGGGIQVTSVSVVDLLHANVGITIPNSTPTGAYNVTLTTGGETATILGGFTVTTGSASISQVQPPTGNQGETNANVQLTGLFTHWVNGTSTASFGAGITVNSLTVTSSTSATANITISAAAATGSRDVSVTTGSEVATLTGGFSVLAGVPALTQASPGTAQAGSTGNIVITGQFTTFQQGFSSVSMGSGVTVNFVTVNSITQLTANITVAGNAGTGPRNITVTTNSQQVTLNNGLTITAGTPVITEITPNIGNPGQNNLNVTIYGQYTNWVNGTTVAAFGGGVVVNTTTVSNATTLTANISIPSGAALGPVDVTTTTNSEVESVPAGFTIQAASIPAPYLLSLSPGPNVSGVPINTTFVAVFSQPMKRSTITSSSFTVQLTSNPGSSVAVAGTVSVDATGRVATFTPAGLLAVNSQYYVYLGPGIQDATGNSFSNYSEYVKTEDAANTTPVTVTAVNPPPNSANIGTNVSIQLEFSTIMEQDTQSGLTVMAGGNPVAGTYGWNSIPYCCGTGWNGPGTVLTFTPSVPLAANTVYTVSYANTLTDTAGNAVTPGVFSFTTGSGSDTSQNSSSLDFTQYLTNAPLNFAPRALFSKPVNPIALGAAGISLYNADSGKYVLGTVTIAPDGRSAQFMPTYPLLPDTYYRFHVPSGNYDADGNNLTNLDGYFTTGGAAWTTAPSVTSIFPPANAASVPLNANLTFVFSAPVDPATINNSTVTVTPTGGGSAIAGTASLNADQVTMTFVPAGGALQPGTQYSVQVSGFSDLAGNAGTTFNSTFTTASSSVLINVSTGVNASGQALTTGGTVDPNWTYYPTSGASGESNFKYPGTQPLEVVASNDTDWYSGWGANGPNSSWIAINPNSTTGNSYGFYSTAFTLPNPLPSAQLCLVGGMSNDDHGLLAINGQPIMADQNNNYNLVPIDINITSYVVPGVNYLIFGFGSTDNYLEGFRLQAVVEQCGASVVNSLTLTSETPAKAATNVATNTSITLTFNNPIDPLTVNATTLPVMVTWNSNQELEGQYSVNGNQVTFTPNSPFPTNTQIYVGACNGPLDIAGDSAGSCYTQLTYFNTGSTATPDSTPFQVAVFSPSSPNNINVGLRTPVSATFNRSVNLSTVNSNDFGLYDGYGSNNQNSTPPSEDPWCTNVSHSQDDETLVFNCYPLPSQASMTAYFGAGLNDWTGDSLQPYAGQFTTSYYDSNTNGAITTSRPGNAVNGIGANEPITLFLNLPVDPGTANNGIQVAQNNQAVPGSVQVLDNGYVLVFTPTSPWNPGALVQWWTTNTLINTTYQTPYSSASGYFFVAGNTSTLVPAVQVLSPTSGSQGAPRNSRVDILFNTPLNPSTVNSNNIYLYDSGTGHNVVASYATPNPNEVIITPNSPLSASNWIYLYLTPGLQSATSVPVASLTSPANFYTSAATDSTVPSIVSAVPYNGASNVSINVAPGVVFSKTIDPNSVNSTTFQVTQGGNPLPGYFWFSSNDTRVEFVPNDALPSNATLTLSINGVTDLIGNPVSFTGTFQTGGGPDYSAPSVVSTSAPSNGSVPTNSTITVQFSTSMDVTTFTAGQGSSCGNFYIYDTLAASCIATTLQWNSTQTIAYLTPAAPLAAGRDYSLYVNSGTDIAGNQMTGYNQTFYADLSSAGTAPTVLHFNPLPNATGVGTNTIIEAQFTAPINPNSVSGVTLKQGSTVILTTPVMSAGNTVVQLVPNVPLLPNTTYTMTVSGVQDPAGNTVATVVNTFTTGSKYDITPPAVVSTDPPNNATVATNVVARILFNKPLNPIAVSSSTFQMYVSDTGESVPLTVTLSGNGEEVTLQPRLPLLAGTKYRYTGGTEDEDGNYLGLPSYYFTTSGGAVTSGPTFGAAAPSESFTVSPPDGSTGVPLNAQVIVNVSVPIDPISWGQSSIQVFDSGNNLVAGTVSLVNVQELAFAPGANLAGNSNYTVKVNNFTDANENPVTPYTSSFTTGSGPVTTGLSVTGTNPNNGATNVAENQPITLTFSQPMDPNTVNGSTLEVMNTWNSGQQLAGTWAEISPTQFQFTPASNYPPGAQITVGSCPGPTDMLGEVLYSGGCYSQEILYFTVNSASPDTTPLTVKSVSPVAISPATTVPVDSSVSVTFNKSINPGTTGGKNSLLFSGQSLQDSGSVTMSNDGQTFTFNVGELNPNTTYTIELPAGGIADWSGNTLASDYTATFTTGSNPATGNGGVVSSLPANNTSGVPTSTLLTLYVNRPVDSTTLAGNLNVAVNGVLYPGTLQAIGGGYEIQYTPTSPFPAGATVQWFFSGVYDTYGDAFNNNSGAFYTAPSVNPATGEPVIVSVSPSCCGSQLVPTNGEIDIQYSLPIDGTTLAGNVYENAGPAAAFTLSQPSPNVVRINPPAGGWNPSTSYYGFCSNGSVKGTNGVAAQSACWLTYFDTTAGPDSTHGTVTVGPPNGATGAGTNTFLRFQFSKPVDRSTVNSTNIQILNGSNPIPGTWSYSYTGPDLYGANFTPLDSLPASSTITVTTSGLLDYAGNTFGATSTSFVTAATPDYSTPTAQLNFGGNTSGIGTNASFTCLYSEAMDPSSINQGNTYLYSYVTSAKVPVTYTWAPDLMALTLTPVSPLYANSEYSFYCQSGIDLTGNGQSGASTYFYTGNGPVAQGPVLLEANPPNGMADVPLNTSEGPWYSTSLQLLFNEPVATDTLGNITLTPQGGNPIPIGVNPEFGNTIAVISLPWQLSPNTQYTFNVSGVMDFSGNPAQSSTSTFTTGAGFDWTNPSVTSTLPANGATNVAVSGGIFSVTFSDVMDPVLFDTNHIYLRTHNTQTTVPGTLSISNTSNSTTVTFTPNAALTANTIYDLVVTDPEGWCLTDVAGNNLNNCSQVASTFTTGAAVALNGSCGSANNQTFTSAQSVPAAGLCSAGAVSGQTNNGTYSWTCNGSGGGTNAPCSATITPASACYAQSNLPANSLLGWWKGDDNATDSSGNGNNGTLENGAAFALGEVNDAFNLNGSNQYVLIGQPVPSDLQIQNAITLQAWVYPTAYSTVSSNGYWSFIMGSEQDSSIAGAALFMNGQNNNISGFPPGGVEFDLGDGTHWHEALTTTQLPLNQWTLLTATATANNPMQVYFNGVAQPTIANGTSQWTGTVSYNGALFAIGQQVEYNRPFTGLIDEVQVYNAALTQAQIQSIYNAGNAGVCP